MKTLFIAEKPSVAKSYCELLEKIENQTFSKKEGFFESNDYYITWCYGHLVSLSEPAEYGWTEWKVEDLPMLPETWKYNVKDDAGAKKQLKTIKELSLKSSEIVNGADPDREGELIVRLILNINNIYKERPGIKHTRFWNHSMTIEDLTKAWKTKKPASEYANLFSSASCRQRADWLIGMNLSRAYGLKSGASGISVGRVQTPTLAMIVERDEEIRNWKQAFFETIQGQWMDLKLNYVGEDQKNGTIEFVTEIEKNEAKSLLSEFNNTDFKTVSLDKKTENQAAPLFFNLADLQKEANKKHGFTAEQTLNTVQSLYEKSFLSYPRTDCNYITEEMYPDALSLMKELNQNGAFLEHLNDSMPQSVNSKKVTAHTALIPTKKLNSAVAGDEQKIYDLVAHRFIQAFGRNKVFQTNNLVISNLTNSHFFKTTSKVPIYLGWDSLNKQESTNESSFPDQINGASIDKLTSVEVLKKERTKPNHFNEATLLTAMERASKNVEDQELKAIIKISGIGTPATRANIIESLKSKNYIVADKKHLISTPKGVSLIAAVNDLVKSPTLTAQWEQQLSDIEEGKISWQKFYDGITEFTKEIVNGVISSDRVIIKAENNTLHKCPECKVNALRINKGGAFCQEDQQGCGFKLFSKQYGKVLSEKAFSDLLLKSKTSPQKLKNKEGKEYTAALIRVKDVVKIEFKKK